MTLRSGLAYIVDELRGMCEAGTAEYTLGSTTYWSDDTLQSVLDGYRQDLRFVELERKPDRGLGGTLLYFEYRAPLPFLEQTTGGTSVFYLQDSTGATLGTSLYSVDYQRGVVTFINTTKGTAIFMSARAYDLNAAAAEVWQKKAAHYAPSSFDFSTDNHSIHRSQIYDHCVDQAKFFKNMSSGALKTTTMVRGDVW